MSRFTQPSQDDGGYILVARMDNAKSLHSILKAINFREVRNLRECDDTKFVGSPMVGCSCIMDSCNNLMC